MAQIKSSFTLNSKYPLDMRDSFDTLEELKNPGMLFDEGHITYCKETGKHYIYNDKYWNNSSGYFKEFIVSGGGSGGSTPDDIQNILDNKVDKEIGKGLSTNDFNDSYKSTLDNLDLDSKVDKVEGKGLSTNDFNDSYKSTLDNLDLDSKVDKVEGKGLSTNDFNDSYKSTLDNLDLDLESKYILKLPFEGIIEEETYVAKSNITQSTFERLESNPIYFLKSPFDIGNIVALKPQFVCYDNSSNPPYRLFDAESIEYFNKSKLSKYQDIDGNVLSKLFINNDNIYIYSNGNLSTLDDFNLGDINLDNKVDKEEGKGLSTNDFNDSYKSTLDNLNLDLESKYILKLPFEGIIEENTRVIKGNITQLTFERLESNPVCFLKNPINSYDNTHLKPQFVCYDNSSNPPYRLFDAESIEYFNKSKLSKYQDIDGNILNKLFINSDNIYFHSNDNLFTLNDFDNSYQSTLDNLNLDLESKYILKLPFEGIIEENTSINKRYITQEVFESLESNPIYFLKNPIDGNTKLKPQFVCYDNNASPHYTVFDAGYIDYFNKSKLSKYQDFDGNIFNKLFINNDNIYIHSNGNLSPLDNINFDSDLDLESKYILKLPFEGIIEENTTVFKGSITQAVFERLESNPIYFLKNPINFYDNTRLKPQFVCYDESSSSHYTLFGAEYIEYFNKSKLSKYQDIDGNISGELFINNDNIYFHSNGNLLALDDIDLDNKVDKEEGKGLSTNDFTNDYKSILDNLDSGDINPGGQILPEYKENCVLWSNYGKTLEWTDKFNSVDYLGGGDNPISQHVFTYGQNKRIVYQKWVDAFNENFGEYPMYIIPNGFSMYIMEPLNTEVENPENPEEPGILSGICICPVPLLIIDNPEESFCNIYNHEIIFRTGENIPDISYIDSMGFELLWEKSAPILESNKIYKISFDTSMTYNPETFENDNMIITGRWVELIGGNTTYGLRKPNINEFFDMIKEKREVI